MIDYQLRNRVAKTKGGELKSCVNYGTPDNMELHLRDINIYYKVQLLLLVKLKYMIIHTTMYQICWITNIVIVSHTNK